MVRRLMLFAARVVPKEWRRLYILIGFRPAAFRAVWKALRSGVSSEGFSGSSACRT